MILLSIDPLIEIWCKFEARKKIFTDFLLNQFNFESPVSLKYTTMIDIILNRVFI